MLSSLASASISNCSTKVSHEANCAAMGDILHSSMEAMAMNFIFWCIILWVKIRFLFLNVVKCCLKNLFLCHRVGDDEMCRVLKHCFIRPLFIPLLHEKVIRYSDMFALGTAGMCRCFGAELSPV